MLKVSSVFFSYGQVPVLHDVSLQVGNDEIVCLLGPNGAGKTTLFRTMSGFLRPGSGSIFIGEHVLNILPPHRIVRLGIGQVPEGRQIFSTLSVRDNLLLAARYGGRQRDGDGQKNLLNQACDLFPILLDKMDARAGSLSGGQQQMLAVARALMTKPRLLLLDEPTLGIAPLLIKELMAKLEELQSRGLGILLIEQNAMAALTISNRAYVLENGRIVMSGPGQDLLSNLQFQKHYLGTARPLLNG